MAFLLLRLGTGKILINEGPYFNNHFRKNKNIANKINGMNRNIGDLNSKLFTISSGITIEKITCELKIMYEKITVNPINDINPIKYLKIVLLNKT